MWFLLVCVCYASYASFVRSKEGESEGGGRLRGSVRRRSVGRVRKTKGGTDSVSHTRPYTLTLLIEGTVISIEGTVKGSSDKISYAELLRQVQAKINNVNNVTLAESVVRSRNEGNQSWDKIGMDTIINMKSNKPLNLTINTNENYPVRLTKTESGDNSGGHNFRNDYRLTFSDNTSLTIQHYACGDYTETYTITEPKGQSKLTQTQYDKLRAHRGLLDPQHVVKGILENLEPSR